MIRVNHNANLGLHERPSLDDVVHHATFNYYNSGCSIAGSTDVAELSNAIHNLDIAVRAIAILLANSEVLRVEERMKQGEKE